MYSILRKVDNHYRKNDIAINGVVISPRYLPKNLNKAILNEVRSFRDDFFDSFSPEITISHDKNGTIYMLVQDVRKRKNIAIINDSAIANLPFLIDKKVYEKDLIRNSCMIKYVDNYMQKVRSNIDITNPGLTIRQKKIKEYEILNETIRKANKQLVEKNKNIFDIVKCNDVLYGSVKKINDYMDYLDDYYKRNVLPYSRKKSR